VRKMRRTDADYQLVSRTYHRAIHMRIGIRCIIVLKSEHYVMSIRLVSCKHCGHKVRLGSMVCGSCGSYTPFVKWTITHVIILIAIIIAIAFALPLLVQ
jgi:hypothetical protein